MSGVVDVVEAASAGAGGVAAIAALLWKPLVRKVADSKAIDIFLHGAPEIPGLRKGITPASIRLQVVETDLKQVKTTQKYHGDMLQQIAANTEMTAHEVSQNSGHSLRDTVERIAEEQTVVRNKLEEQ